MYRFYQGPLVVNGMVKGLLFCNITHIQEIEQYLRNVCKYNKNYYFVYNIVFIIFRSV